VFLCTAWVAPALAGAAVRPAWAQSRRLKSSGGLDDGNPTSMKTRALKLARQRVGAARQRLVEVYDEVRFRAKAKRREAYIPG
jgi:hypothetical protein